ncbi:hypothetical protein UPYG_G00242980 [Umbra pygmaea]|uniref:Uncharacterized protein n=1 Tax=Umbra pygmaea TaxID=75934 RepID=A0ABD0WL21_UMBPY
MAASLVSALLLHWSFSRVGAHFISGEAAMDIDSPDCVPSVFPYKSHNKTKTLQAKHNRVSRKRKGDEKNDRTPRPAKSNPAQDQTTAAIHAAASESTAPNDYRFDYCTEDMVPKFTYNGVKLKHSQLSTEYRNLHTDNTESPTHYEIDVYLD